MKWKPGDRVVRWKNMDNGVWAAKGDSCLPGPLRHGVVVRTYREPSHYGGVYDLVEVLFDDGLVKSFLKYGLRKEVNHH